ncbi:MAG: type II toxin-antitoxin system RelE/ParE family toxin [Desulfobacteraceae bacterium]|jgi:proteic killer suppression protein
MIKSFRCKETNKIFKREYSKKLPTGIQRIAFRKLRMLNRASILDDLKMPPGNKLEMLRGDRAGQCSIRINDQWRICFKWNDQDVFDVEIVDYH